MAKDKHYKHKIKKVSDLIPYINNSRTHSESQVNQIASSIKEFGFTSPVLIEPDGGIIAGHGRVLAAQKLNIKEIPCIVIDGLTEAQKKAYVIADNSIALNSEWDMDVLESELDSLEELGFDTDVLALDFNTSEIDDFVEDSQGSSQESEYTQKIEAPVYEVKGHKPSLVDLVDLTKRNQLLQQIKAANLSKEESDFLIEAASRHSVFKFDLIAEYYAHSSKKVQELMENSAMVIIDYDKAVENGFTQIKAFIDENTPE